MPWKESTCMTQRREFVLLANVSDVNVSQLCERFGISRKTGLQVAGQDKSGRRPDAGEITGALLKAAGSRFKRPGRCSIIQLLNRCPMPPGPCSG